jgi:quinoprotein glucose dehydrogenase
MNLFANCLLALDAATGKHLWHFQFMHHDVWDKDLPTPPVLITLNRNGRRVDAVAQSTKNGYVYVFDRVTGEPLFDIEEVPVDTVSELEGEKLWPTQPVPVLPAPYSRQTLTDQDVNPYVSDSVKQVLLEKLKSYRIGSKFLPPGKTPSLVFPGYDGGGEWGGPAVDRETGILYVNANEMAWVMQMNENPIENAGRENWLQAGKRLYKQNCASCHGMDRKGTGNNSC